MPASVMRKSTEQQQGGENRHPNVRCHRLLPRLLKHVRSGRLFEFDIVSEGSDSLCEVSGGAFGVVAIAVVWAEVLVECSVLLSM